MRNALLALVLVAGLALATAPPATAFHGGPYRAEGTATFLELSYTAVVVWTGVQVNGLGTYRVELKDSETGALVHKNQVQGQESFPNVQFIEKDGCPSVEHAEYWGYDAASGGTVFELTGFQERNFCTGAAYMEYHGHYLVFQLDLTVM